MSDIAKKIKEIEELKLKIKEEQEDLKDEAQNELSNIIKEIDRLEEKKQMLETFLDLNAPIEESAHARPRRNTGTMKAVLEIIANDPKGLAVRDVLDVIARDKLPIKPQSVSSSLSYAYEKGLVTRDAMGIYRINED